MAARFVFQGREFPIVDSPLFAEIDFVERRTGQALDEWSKTMSTRAFLFWAIRRVDPQLLTWEALGELPLDAVDIIDDEEDAAAADAGPPASAEPSGSPFGTPVAAGSSPTSETPTSSI